MSKLAVPFRHKVWCLQNIVKVYGGTLTIDGDDVQLTREGSSTVVGWEHIGDVLAETWDGAT